jgi:hypothetical protein
MVWVGRVLEDCAVQYEVERPSIAIELSLPHEVDRCLPLCGALQRRWWVFVHIRGGHCRPTEITRSDRVAAIAGPEVEH